MRSFTVFTVLFLGFLKVKLLNVVVESPPPVSLQAKDTEIRGTKFVVAGLKEGGLYRFRVRAVNAAGEGDNGLVSELIEVKDRTSKTLIQ